jgi:hypothetical protein
MHHQKKIGKTEPKPQKTLSNVSKEEKMKKRTLALKDLRSATYDPENRDHKKELSFEVMSMQNTTRFKIGQTISQYTVDDLNRDPHWVVNIKK